MHAATYSGHATCCAVGLATSRSWSARTWSSASATMGAKLLAGLQTLADNPMVGEVRGLGLMAGVELMADPQKGEFFDPP